MIRFVDLKDQITEGVFEFAFYDTVTDTFVAFNGLHAFDSEGDFRTQYNGEHSEISRFTEKIPDFYNENSDNYLNKHNEL